MDTEKRSINGREYQFYYLPSKQAIKILIRMLKVLGSSLGKGLSSVADVKNVLDQEINIGGLIDGLLDKIDEDFALKLINELLEHVHIEAGSDKFKKVNIDLDFRGPHLGDLFLVLKEAIVINYADFFGAASAAMKEAGAAIKEK